MEIFGCCLWKLLLTAFFLAIPFLYQLSPSFKYYFKMFNYNMTIMIIALFTILYSLPRPRWRGNYFFVKTCADYTLRRIANIDMTVRGREHLENDKPAIIIMNHQSSLDMIPMMEIWPKNCTSLAKKELLYAGTFGAAAWLCGCIYIDRLNTEKARKTIADTAQMINDEKIKILIFPEGTRNHNKEMLPFKKGAFHLAVQGQVPLIPVVVSTYSGFYDKKAKRFDGGQILVQILPPIPTEGLTKDNVTELTDKAKDIMENCYHRINEDAKHLK